MNDDFFPDLGNLILDNMGDNINAGGVVDLSRQMSSCKDLVARPTHLCGSLKGLSGIERHNTKDEDLNSFGPRETSSGNNPTCCLRLGLIMMARESP